jgi:hypothetical protein
MQPCPRTTGLYWDKSHCPGLVLPYAYRAVHIRQMPAKRHSDWDSDNGSLHLVEHRWNGHLHRTRTMFIDDPKNVNHRVLVCCAVCDKSPGTRKYTLTLITQKVQLQYGRGFVFARKGTHRQAFLFCFYKNLSWKIVF